jgi:hypothetical protein
VYPTIDLEYATDGGEGRAMLGAGFVEKIFFVFQDVWPFHSRDNCKQESVWFTTGDIGIGSYYFLRSVWCVYQS